ncbi:MAG: CobW family GTP-binding protein [Fastidiosipilaceae bacterium]|jgi:G3E family GTPase
MIDMYLVTGFLGAGKTTFLKEFLRSYSSKRMRVIVNEYGKVGVDAELIAELGVVLEEINNGSIFCSCRLDHFEKALQETLLDPPELLIVEASGLSDPTSIRYILRDERFQEFRYRGAICLVDPLNIEKVLNTARVSAKQLSVADLVLINKTDAATEEQLKRAIELVKERNPGAEIHSTSFGVFKREWVDDIEVDRFEQDETVHGRDLTLQKNAIRVKDGMMSQKQMEHFIRMFVEETYRVKGFARLTDGLYLVDCVGAMVDVSPWRGGEPENVNTIVALAGQGMALRKSVKAAIRWYADYIESE